MKGHWYDGDYKIQHVGREMQSAQGEFIQQTNLNFFWTYFQASPQSLPADWQKGMPPLDGAFLCQMENSKDLSMKIKELPNTLGSEGGVSGKN
jgi:hypothetical protein